MTKLPLNPLLYLLSSALLVGVGWIFYQAIVAAPKPKDRKELIAEVDTAVDRGRKLEPPGLTWSYDPPGWWSKVATVNFTGKLPPKEVVKDPESRESRPKITDRPLDDIFVLVSTIFGGDDTSCVIRYKPSPELQRPPEMLASSAPGMDIVAPTTPVPTPSGTTTPPNRAAPAMPVRQDPGQNLQQHLKLEGTLWKPYDYIRLVRIADDASAVFFIRERPDVPKEQWKEEPVFHNELGLPKEVLDAYEKLMGIAKTGGSAASKPTSRAVAKPDGWKPPPGGVSQWENDVMHVAEKDYDDLARNSDRIVNEDLQVESYRGKTMSGLSIKKVSPELQKYGIANGDIITHVNDKKVTSKAEGISVSKREWQAGVRTFVVRFTRKGEDLSRTIHFPNK